LRTFWNLTSFDFFSFVFAFLTTKFDFFLAFFPFFTILKRFATLKTIFGCQILLKSFKFACIFSHNWFFGKIRKAIIILNFWSKLQYLNPKLINEFTSYKPNQYVTKLFPLTQRVLLHFQFLPQFLV
jgi:hypothetical protein